MVSILQLWNESCLVLTGCFKPSECMKRNYFSTALNFLQISTFHHSLQSILQAVLLVLASGRVPLPVPLLQSLQQHDSSGSTVLEKLPCCGRGTCVSTFATKGASASCSHQRGLHWGVNGTLSMVKTPRYQPAPLLGVGLPESRLLKVEAASPSPWGSPKETGTAGTRLRCRRAPGRTGMWKSRGCPSLPVSLWNRAEKAIFKKTYFLLRNGRQHK